MHSLNTPTQFALSTYSLNTPTQYTLSTYSLNTPTQFSLSTYSLNTPHNLPYQHTLSTCSANTLYAHTGARRPSVEPYSFTMESFENLKEIKRLDDGTGEVMKAMICTSDDGDGDSNGDHATV